MRERFPLGPNCTFSNTRRRRRRRRRRRAGSLSSPFATASSSPLFSFHHPPPSPLLLSLPFLFGSLGASTLLTLDYCTHSLTPAHTHTHTKPDFSLSLKSLRSGYNPPLFDAKALSLFLIVSPQQQRRRMRRIRIRIRGTPDRSSLCFPQQFIAAPTYKS